MLSTDKKILDPTSAVSFRMQKYADSFGELTIVVFARGEKSGLQKRGEQLSIYCAGGNYITSYYRGFKASLWFKGDIVTSQDAFELGLMGLYVAFRLQLPLQVQVHTDLGHEYKKAGLRQRLQVRIATYVLPRADCVRVVSLRSVENMRELGLKLQRPPVVLPVYVDAEKFTYAEHSDVLQMHFPQFSHIALWVGRFEYEKNPEAAVHAFVEVVRTEQSAGLVFLGEGSRRASLERLAASLGIAESVKFLPFDDPALYYKSADLLVVTSRYEGFGMAIVEAIASGLPVISYDVGIAREVGAVVAPPALLPQAIVESFRDPKMPELPDHFKIPEEKYLLAYTDALRTCSKVA